MKEKPPGVTSYGLAILVGLPFTAVGLFCLVTIILIPLGAILLLIGSLPLYLVDRRKLKWIMRDQPLETDEVKPWE
jgi:hypothetical protein